MQNRQESPPVERSRLRSAVRVVLGLWVLVAIGVFATGCSDVADPVVPAPQAEEPNDGDARSGDDESAEPDDTESPADDGDERNGGDPSADESPPVDDLDDQVDEIITVALGDQIEDRLGNLIAVYGMSPWPASYQTAQPLGRDDVALFGDLERTWARADHLVALDIGMCVQADPSTDTRDEADPLPFSVGLGRDEREPLDDFDLTVVDPVQIPVLEPAFRLAGGGECSRGWVVVGSSESDVEQATVARLVHPARPGEDESRRILYQWTLDGDQTTPAIGGTFAAGELVTFNAGALEGTAIRLNGWTELIGIDSTVPDTRLVAVSVEVCPRGGWPRLAVAVDGWNLASQVDEADRLGSQLVDDVTGECFEGWLDFAVPLGGVPTGFVATDGVDPVTGFASWSLVGSALPAPR